MNLSAERASTIEVQCGHLPYLWSDALLIHRGEHVVFVNDECLRLFGADRQEQLLGLPSLELVPSEQRAIAKQVHDRVLANPKEIDIGQSTRRRLDGTSIDVEHRILPIRQSDQSIAVMEALRSRSDVRPQSDIPQATEIPVVNVLETAMDGIISINQQQEIVLFNKAAETMFGWRSEQMIGRPIEILIPSQFRQRHHSDVEQFGRGTVQNRRMGVQRTVTGMRASGEEFPIEASISQTSVNGAKIYTVIVRDVTEAVKYRQKIEQQSQMLDQVSDSVMVVDLNNIITYWNQAATRVFGWTAQEALGQQAQELLYRGDPQVFADMLRDTLARNSWFGELTKTNRSGESLTVEHRRSVLRDQSRKPQGFLCIDIDVTGRKKRERAAHRSQRLESIGTLAGGIAHDLNNVLTPILMGTKLLASRGLREDPQALLKTMQTSAERGAELVKQVLAFAGGIRGDRSPVDVAQVIRETCDLLEHTLSKSIRIESSVDVDCPLVLGDMTELSQVLMNLCINARDAMANGGVLTIRLGTVNINGDLTNVHPDVKPGSYLCIRVSDTGTGMSPAVLDRIFDPFFTTKEVGKGTGLGLATVQGIVKSHDGFINVYSELERGTTFSIYLPIHEEQKRATSLDLETAERNKSPEKGFGKIVLLVDDEASILQMTAMVLEVAGYRVFTAQDGPAAIATFLQHHDEISVVLLDMMMPGLDGLQTIDQLRKINPQVAVIASSGLRTNQREEEVLEHGAKAFLAKPYSEGQLLDTLSKVLNDSH